MKIRSITYFCNPEWPINKSVLQQAGKFNQQARSAFKVAGFDVQTSRMATIPFPRIIAGSNEEDVVEFACTLELLVKKYGFDYVSIGPASTQTPVSFKVIPKTLAATETVFMSGFLESHSGGIDLQAVRACADAILTVCNDYSGWICKFTICCACQCTSRITIFSSRLPCV